VSEPNNYLDNFYSIFSSIKERTKECINTILVQYKDKNLLSEPFVDVENIAYNKRIKEIYLVSPEKVNNEHSSLNNDIIYLNRDNSLEEWLFSIAHEIAHWLNSNSNSRIGRPIYRIEANPKFETLEKKLFNLSIIIGLYSIAIANYVSQIIGKPVSGRNASIILKKMANEYYCKNENENFTEREAKFSAFKKIEIITELFLNRLVRQPIK
jgi:hypothetical protein